MEKIILIEYTSQSGEERYQSADGIHRIERSGHFPNSWNYIRNNRIIDTDRYRFDLAERNKLQLEYPESE